jgi:hypothetical protein
VIPVEVTQTPWHYTTFWDWLDHWQTLVAGLIALLAACIAVFGAEIFARCKERREIQALRASLASEIRLYVDLLIKMRGVMTKIKEVYRSGGQPPRDFRDLATLPPPIIYPAAADRLGHLRRPGPADVVEFYATIEKLNFSVRAVSNKHPEKLPMPNYIILIKLFEAASLQSLPLLSALPFDKRDAEFRAEIAKWDAEFRAEIAQRQKDAEK